MTQTMKLARRLGAMALAIAVLTGILVSDRADARVADGSSTSRPDTKDLKTRYPSLSHFATNLTQLALQGKLNAVPEREKEIRQAAHILSRDLRNNPIFLAEPGHERSVIVAGLAYRMAAGNVPQPLRSKLVFSLNLSEVTAEAKDSAEFQSDVNAVLNDVKQAHGQIILFIDDLPQLLHTDGKNSAKGLNETLRDGVQIIGATTVATYQEAIVKDTQIAPLFDRILVGDPTLDNIADSDDSENADDDDTANRGVTLSPGLQELAQSAGSDRSRVDVILQLAKLDSAKLRELQNRGALHIKNQFPRFGLIEAEVAVRSLKDLAANANVRHASL